MRKARWLVAGFLAVVVAGAVLWLRYGGNEPDGKVVVPADYRTTVLSVGGEHLTLEVAETAEQVELGLGERDTMASDHGMLFVFPYADRRCFWMKGMRFPLDIIWLDKHKQVAHIEKSLSPDTYPQEYCPSDAAQYVVELTAGKVDKLGIQTGGTLPVSP